MITTTVHSKNTLKENFLFEYLNVVCFEANFQNKSSVENVTVQLPAYMSINLIKNCQITGVNF